MGGAKRPPPFERKCGYTGRVSGSVMRTSRLAPGVPTILPPTLSTGLKYRKGFSDSTVNVNVCPAPSVSSGSTSFSSPLPCAE